MAMKFYTIIFLALISCDDKEKDKNIFLKSRQYNSDKIIKNQDSISFKDIMLFNKQEAILKYGMPLKQEVLKLKDMQGEFWEGLENKFTEKEKLKEIIIHELTWEKDSLNFITVWYKKTPSGLIPRDSYIWNKELEF